MPDSRKKYAELQREIKSLRLRVAELERGKLRHKRAEEALRKSEEKFRPLMESADDLMSIVDKDRNLTYVNESMARTLGYSKEEMIGMNVTQVLSKQDLEKKFKSKSEELIAKGEINFEATWVTKDREEIHGELKVVAIYDSDGKYAGNRAVFHNITKRRKAEDALQRSELLYRTLMENIHLGISFVDTDHRIVITNAGLGKFFRKPRSEFVGKYCFREFEKRSAVCSHCPGTRAMATGCPAVVETEGVRDDGSRFSARLHAFPILEADGAVKGFIEVVEDITERKRAEEALRESEERYRELVEETPDVIYTLDTVGNVTSVNKAGKVMFGREPEEVIGRHFAEWIPKEELPDAVAAFKRILGGEKITAETILIDKDGNPHNVEFSSTPIIKAGKVIGTRGIIRDITESRKAEEKLKESERRFKTIFDNAADGILLADVENKKFYIGNKVFCQMLGYSPQELKRIGVMDIHPEQDLPYVMEQFAKQARKEITLAENIPVKRKDGSVFYADINSFPIKLTGKTYLMGIFRDITEHKKIEEELNIYQERMARAERLASLGTLSATLAHELTQPLTVIRLSIENSLEELEATSCSKTVVEGLRDSLNEVSNATSVVDRFRNFARESSKRTLSETDIGAVADRIVQLLGRAAQRAKMTLHLESMDTLPPVYSNERDLEQLFFALTENAIQAADDKKSHRLTITGSVKDENIELRFSDNCSGIVPENLDKIFDPFFTTGSDDTRTGLGLSIVQRIVSGYGGKISVQSQVGKGTNFYITLPINPQGPQEREQLE